MNEGTMLTLTGNAAKLEADVNLTISRDLTFSNTNNRTITIPEWRPIETAPKNGDDILVWSAWLGHHVVAYDESNPDFVWATLDGPSYRTDAFEVWMPLPEPPDQPAETAA